jgi:hypothetical protein
VNEYAGGDDRSDDVGLSVGSWDVCTDAGRSSRSSEDVDAFDARLEVNE